MSRIAKDIVSVAILLHCAATGFSQELIIFGNTFGSGTTGFRALIYGPNPNDPFESLSGNSSIGNPAGTTAYAGPLLQGTGYSIALFSGPAGVTDPGLLMLVSSTTFRTATANVPPAGLIHAMQVAVNGVLPGQVATFQVRAWDGGAITSWEQVL